VGRNVAAWTDVQYVCSTVKRGTVRAATSRKEKKFTDIYK